MLLSSKFLQHYLSTTFDTLIISSIIRDALLYINVQKKYFILLINILKNHTLLCFDFLMDIWIIDFPQNLDRFQTNYYLTSSIWAHKLILRLTLGELEPHVSVTNYYPSAGWLERESWDMFGVYFYGNPDLRRILTDYGFEGFPLRKDFPISGYYELRFDYENKRVTFDSIELTQEFRFFYFQKSWNNN